MGLLFYLVVCRNHTLRFWYGSKIHSLTHSTLFNALNVDETRSPLPPLEGLVLFLNSRYWFLFRSLGNGKRWVSSTCIIRDGFCTLKLLLCFSLHYLHPWSKNTFVDLENEEEICEKTSTEIKGLQTFKIDDNDGPIDR